MFRLKWLFLAIAAVLVAVLLWKSYSTNSSLKKALGLSQLPASIQNQHVKVHNLIDYIIEGYFEITPNDFNTLLAARKYKKVNDLSEKQVNLRMLPIPSSFIVSESYKWDGPDSTDCIISTNSDKTKVSVVYFRHFY